MKKQNEQQPKDLIKSNKNITGKTKVTATSTEAKWKQFTEIRSANLTNPSTSKLGRSLINLKLVSACYLEIATDNCSAFGDRKTAAIYNVFCN